MNHSSLADRLSEPGPKRLLALDGGGIRGLVTLGYLARIEEMLRRRYDDPQLVLSDYFDLIGGTSTGAIIASALALGWPVVEIHLLYSTLGRDAFRPKRSWLGPVSKLVSAKFDDASLAALLRQSLGDRTLGSPDLRVGLMVVAKRADTASVWVLVNIPNHKFFEANRDLKLWEIVRASTAAPTYFKPQWISDVGDGEAGVFLDGGVSMHNNPALQLLMVANLRGFALSWPLGDENLFLCSVGTGGFTATPSKSAMKKYSNLHWLGLAAIQMMRDASELNQTVLQWLSDSPTARTLDRQIEALSGDQLGARPLISYLRYNVELEHSALQDIGLDYSPKKIESLRSMSEVKNVSELGRIGIAAAGQQVKDAHFPRSFDRRR
jgi:hypothetical protein